MIYFSYFDGECIKNSNSKIKKLSIENIKDERSREILQWIFYDQLFYNGGIELLNR